MFTDNSAAISTLVSVKVQPPTNNVSSETKYSNKLILHNLGVLFSCGSHTNLVTALSQSN